ncbi:adenylosuccinate synthetase [Protofrankia symbiont of Coriaria ruscifolia]|uniref:Adenylosuccinate synthetase n=2 Tax=Candidatus Protofrankia californiensis TaxID=1839754 RepID=A0A1C3PBR2_9ACTN|nr:adenylosuccinate synthetase [Protofrankia symbiont of Coriaria ruscifolia]SBW27118.1 adenylosuccinate synthetase [Candidatus Protofrankia californiensis]
MPHRHTIVVDLGFGDAGKGTVVDHLCARASVRGRPVRAVIRFNGGAQAAHNVVTDDGRHHTFAQIGSGAFTAGTATHLSRHMLVDPLALAAEADHLEAAGVPGPLARLTVHRDALITTPYHVAANRIRERARVPARHGSCGMGIGETVAHALAHPDDSPRAGDCLAPTRLRRLLTVLRDRLTDELGPLAAPAVDDCAAAFRAFSEAVDLVDDSYVRMLLRGGPVVFEGAQGVLLDEWNGFHPYTTWSTATPANADKLLADAGMAGEALRLGVVRTYTTRHGAGPLVTEEAELTAALPDVHNGTGPWQGAFRVGHFDAVAHRYAADVVGGVDAIALTHLDVAARHRLAACHAYEIDGVTVTRLAPEPSDGRVLRQVGEARVPGSPGGQRRHDHAFFAPSEARVPGTLVGQARLTSRLARAQPVLEPVPDAAAWPRLVQEALGAPVTLLSYGPRSRDKRSRSVAGMRGR